MRQVIGLIAVILVTSGVCTPGVGFAQWTSLNDGPSNLSEVALARDTTGVLHVVTKRKTSSTTDSYLYQTISEDGVLGPQSEILSSWTALNYPGLVLKSDGSLALFFSGLRTTNSVDPFASGRLYRMSSDATRTTWSLDSSPYSSGNTVYATDVAAALTNTGVELATIGAAASGSSAPSVYKFDTGTQIDTEAQTCCSYKASIARDEASDAIVVGWYSNATNLAGLYYQQVFPSLSSRIYAPASANNTQTSASGGSARTPLAARAGGGLYSAYCAGYIPCTGVVVWKYGTTSSIRIPGTQNAELTAIARGLGGRLWTFWKKNTTIYVSISNALATKFAPPFSISAPTGTDVIYRLSGDGSSGPLDLFVVASGASVEPVTFHQRVLPRLVMTISPRRISTAQVRVSVKVTDGIDALTGVRVKLGAQDSLTSSKGIASFKVPAGKAKLKLTAKKALFQSASKTIRRRG